MTIALVDLYAGGHHRMYVELLTSEWLRQERPGQLSLWVSAAFARQHADLLGQLTAAGISCHTLRRVEEAREGVAGLRALLKNDRMHGHALSEVAEAGPDHIVFLYMDHAQLAIGRYRKPTPRVSGILFRPTFHMPSSGLKHALTNLRKRIVLNKMLQSPALHRVFCLDPWAAAALGGPRAVHLPDGITLPGPDVDPEALREELGLGDAQGPDHSPVFLMFGVLSERKGMLALADAWRGQGHLVLAGRVPKDEPLAETAATRLAARPDVTWMNEYVSEARMASLFRAADVVLVPYQHHVGSSNVLIRAAAAGKPVIGSNSGLVGRLIAEHHLGLAVDTTQPDVWADALASAGALPFDPASAARFAAANTPEAMGATLYDSLLS
jgi:glycosyltransferase involved in cell wall biosynthesis